MKTQKRITKQRQRRQFRVSNRIRRSVSVCGRPRLSVFRSNKHIYAQIIDDKAGRTLVAACTLEKNVSVSGQCAGNRESAVKVGRLLAERALEQGIKEVVLDRGRNIYHGRVAALADAAREGGLQF